VGGGVGAKMNFEKKKGEGTKTATPPGKIFSETPTIILMLP